MKDDLISRQAAIDALAEHEKSKGHNYTMFVDVVSECAEIIRDLPSVQQEQRWIPVSERLPNCNGCYLVWRPHFFGGKNGMSSICYFDGKDTWHDSYDDDFTRTLQSSNVTAWMPLPEPYREE